MLKLEEINNVVPESQISPVSDHALRLEMLRRKCPHGKSAYSVKDRD
jgi:hypothetical protein